MTDWTSKLPGAVARIAALLHIARYEQPWERHIGPESMTPAIRLGEVLSKHALIAFDLMKADPAVDDARTILEWVRREGKSEFTHRDCQAAHKHRFSRADDLDAPLDILSERCFIRPRPRSIGTAGGRPSRLFDVNPATLEVQT
jgi:hypothetical protein